MATAEWRYSCWCLLKNGKTTRGRTKGFHGDFSVCWVQNWFVVCTNSVPSRDFGHNFVQAHDDFCQFYKKIPIFRVKLGVRLSRIYDCQTERYDRCCDKDQSCRKSSKLASYNGTLLICISQTALHFNPWTDYFFFKVVWCESCM